MARNQHSEILK